MNFRESLKNTSLIFLLGICLILFGLIAYSLTPHISPITPTLSISPISQISFAKVTHVIDGDTIVIETGEHVRYIGINTPEMETSECYATEASEINKNLVLGKTVKLEKDVSNVDKYGRLLRFVYVDDILVDDNLIKNGAAKIMTVPPDVKYKDEFLSSQYYAKENKLGLWGKCP